MTHVDTSFIIDLMREQAKGVPAGATELLQRLEHEDLAQSVFVACELEVGALRARRPLRGKVCRR